jgi:hypothetical protein
MDNISDKSDNDINILKIDDIKKIWKKDFIDLSKLDSPFDIINWIEKPNINVKVQGKLFNFYIFVYNNIFLIGFFNSTPKSWYKIKSINELHIFIDYFNITTENKSTLKQIKLYLKSKFNFKQIIRYFYLHDFIDKSILSDNDKIEVKNIKLQDEVLLIDKFLETITDNSIVTFTTLYSKSKLILNSNGDDFYLQIIFKPFNLSNRFKILSKDVPSDVDIVLLNLNIIRIEDLIENIKNLNGKDIDIIFNIAPRDTLISIMKNIIKSKPDLEIYITKKIKEIDLDLTLNKMEKDGIFRAFENSLDILLKTIYERFNDSEYDQSENMLDLNKKIKEKITKIFELKILV